MSNHLENLKKYFGYSNFRPLQEEIINEFCQKQDLVVLMPTGGGKSLCYQLPALVFDGMTIVISPLISLMKDQVDALTANGIPATFLNSSIDGNELQRRMQKAMRGEYRLIYMAPERLAVAGINDWLQSCNVSALAIDEAHCISQWGHDFRPDYRNLKLFRQSFPDIPIVALTATATLRVREDIISELSLIKPKTFVSSFYRENLHIRVIPKKDERRKIKSLLSPHKNESCIVYCFSKKDTVTLADFLQHEGFSAGAYHAGLESTKRSQIQDDFIHGRIKIITATTAFGMGIDKPDIRLVVHRTFPKTLEGYYQEIGRAGRDGLPSGCVMLYSAGDKIKLDYFLSMVSDEKERQKELAGILNVMNYAESRTCRWINLIKYFGEVPTIAACGTCDVCQSKSDMVDSTEITQKILSGIIKTNERFGRTHILKVLRGSNEKKILDYGHDSLSVWGIAKDISENILIETFMQLVAHEFVQKNVGEYPTYSVTQRGKRFLIKKEKIMLPRISKERLGAATKNNLIKNKNITDRKNEVPYRKTDQHCFELLKALRRELAEKRDVPAFIIFTDASLHDMAYNKPQTTEEFKNVSGVGEKKLKEYGEIFLKAICHYVQVNSSDSQDSSD
ncbi:MAG TPA: DNA helicase RecQ [Candidatus Paceibacterota bacterium]|nr:DNA helicase RecQ [Candidatus Paceibacterota bacterium]HMO82820.1 DNA helicase RecQ [Candidatus Paceibacterota bacterium]